MARTQSRVRRGSNLLFVSAVADLRSAPHDDEIDRYREGQFVVSVFSKRNLGQVNKIIKRYLDNENLSELAIVTRLDRPGA